MARNEPALSPLAQHAARLEATGLGATEIHRQTGASLTTVKRWRANPEYRALRDRLMAEANAKVLERATSVRLKGLRLVERSVDAGHVLLDAFEAQDDNTPEEQRIHLGPLGLAQLAKTGLEAYRTTAAQTGISETTRQEVTVSAPEEARRKLHEELAALGLDTLRALKAKQD
jgi:hypothetical protein